MKKVIKNPNIKIHVNQKFYKTQSRFVTQKIIQKFFFKFRFYSKIKALKYIVNTFAEQHKSSIVPFGKCAGTEIFTTLRQMTEDP